MEDNNDNLVVLVDEDGQEQEFEHIDTFEYNDRTYVVLIPFDGAEDEKDEDEEEVVILRVELEGDEETLVSIDDDEELDNVFEEFQFRSDELYDLDDYDDEEDEM